jgi:type II secretory ATPase GspE/PulE/Tfp pilus assembly ATPase PilB-like protein
VDAYSGVSYEHRRSWIADRLQRLASVFAVDVAKPKPKGHPPSLPFYRGTGCPSCGGRGFRGRLMVPEVLSLDPGLRDAINADLSYQEMRALARRGGMHTLTENALELARDGRTTLEEAYAVRLD